MILSAQIKGGKSGRPWLVFLHGFSGDRREWQPIGASFCEHPQMYIDLPGHGGSSGIHVNGFEDSALLIRQTLAHYGVREFFLIGYSLGGRIAMFTACKGLVGLKGLIVEGGHPGLQDQEAKEQRRLSDQAWAKRFRSEPLPKVFTDWYQQPVFSSLTQKERSALIALRSRNNGETLAAMLESTSLSAQPDLRQELKNRTFAFHYLCGEKDAKFRALAKELCSDVRVIENAGHNAHRENPEAVAEALADILRS